MKLEEKYNWMKFFAVQFVMGFLFMSAIAVSRADDVEVARSVSGQAAFIIVAFYALLALILLFRITYLKGKNSGH